MIRPIFIAVFFGIPARCFADDFNIEDYSMSDPPAGVQLAIRRDPTYSAYQRCVITGKKVHLSADSSTNFFAVTTANGCNWGAALGPIWIVAFDAKRAKVILASGGASLRVEAHTRNGLRNVTLTTGTAREITDNLFKFNGKRYVHASFRRYPAGR